MINQTFTQDEYHFARPAEAALLMDSFLTGENARTIYDIRRVGKTRFLTRDLAKEARSRGFYVIDHDFMDGSVDHQAEFVTKLAVGAGSQELLAAAKSIFAAFLSKLDPRKKAKSKVSVGLPSGPSVSYEQEPISEAQQQDSALQLLRAAFTAAKNQHPGGLLLILDEFQELAKGDAAHVRRNAAFLKALRSILQQKDSEGLVKVVFAGSDEAMLQRMFSNYAHAFYGFGTPFKLDRLGLAFVNDYCLHLSSGAQGIRQIVTPEQKDFLIDRFMGEFLQSPKRSIAFMTKIREHPGRSLDVLAQEVMREFPVRRDYAAVLESLLGLDRIVLWTVACGARKPYSNENLALIASKYGSKRGHSTVQGSIERLCGHATTKKNIAETHLTAGAAGYEFIDPEFEKWLQEHGEALFPSKC